MASASTFCRPVSLFFQASIVPALPSSSTKAIVTAGRYPLLDPGILKVIQPLQAASSLSMAQFLSNSTASPIPRPLLPDSLSSVISAAISSFSHHRRVPPLSYLIGIPTHPDIMPSLPILARGGARTTEMESGKPKSRKMTGFAVWHALYFDAIREEEITPTLSTFELCLVRRCISFARWITERLRNHRRITREERFL